MYDKYFKRILDILLILITLPFLIPLYLIVAIAIKLDSKGPVIFKQERLGKDGKVFEILKFRTMVDNAESMGTGINTFDGDPRITRVGSILRKTSLDEIPQLINVLIGDMSLVGPRPPVPYHPRKYEEYNKEQVKRFTVRPGITGHAQVIGRNALVWDERIVLDVEYVEKQSFLLDIKILFQTLINVIKRDNIHSDRRKNKQKNQVNSQENIKE